jgi:hypothetical protein
MLIRAGPIEQRSHSPLGYKYSACTVSIIDMNKLSIARSPCVYMVAAAVYLHIYIHKYEYILIRTHHCIREAN